MKIIRVSRQAIILVLLFNPFIPVYPAATIWRCGAIDNHGVHWIGTGHYPKNAIYKAKEQCKKQSKNPWKCYASRELCHVYSAGQSRIDYWRCTAFDKAEGTWKSGPYGNRSNAAKGAMNYCRAFSNKPDSCFLHFVTCKEES